MPIDCIRDERRRWLLARASDALSLEDTTTFLRTARARAEDRMWPMLVDARACRTTMTEADVEAAVAIVRAVARRNERRAHVAIAADDDALYQWFLLYEAKCADAGVRVIRIFRQLQDAERWLEIVSAARELA
jgi:hypothetical protein